MKKLLALFCACFFLIGLAACSSDGNSSEQIGELEKRIQELEEENTNLREQLESLGTTDEPEDQSAEQPEDTEETVDAETIELGSTVTIPDLCDFTVNYADLKKEVLPPNPGSYYSYYQEEDGMTYIDVAISVKNLRTTARVADEFGTVKAICGDGYEYDSYSIIEEPGGVDFTYTNITSVDPLETAVLHYLVSFPNELADDPTSSIVLEITMLDNDYILTLR